MADVFTKRKRSEIMALIRAKNTGIEKTMFRYLRRSKIHFQPHYSRAPGKPDIAVPSKQIAVFIDGDFWHGYRFSSWKRRIPKQYWREKIESNMRRDARNRRTLRRRGWRVFRVWGREIIRDPEKACAKVAAFLAQ